MIPNSQFIDVRLPEEFIKILSKTGVGKSLDDKLRLSLAISFFVEKTVTLEKAAELAGKPITNFIEILQDKGLSWMEYSEENVDEDEFAIKRYIDEIGVNNEHNH